MANEKRLIDANKVAQDVRENNKENFFQADWSSKRVCELLESAPVVDAVEVVHGRWELHGDDDSLSGSYFCSECGYCLCEEEYLDQFSSFRCCPYCGAKMDGDLDV